MNKYILIALCMLSLFVCACKKDKQENNNHKRFLTADKDDTSWISTGGVFAEVGGAKNYHIAANKGEERLLIRMTTNSLNQYVLVTDKTEFTITVGQDVITARYMLDNSAENSINITNYDTKRVIMEGNFKLTFKKVSGLDSYPASSTFTNGRFSLSPAYD